mgnify:CR=1 FL=1
MVDITTPVIPDAMNRIRQKQQDKKQEKIDKKKKLLEQMEISRAQVLDSYNIKTMLWLKNNKLELELTVKVKFEMLKFWS